MIEIQSLYVGKRQYGFTLLEILIGTSLLGVMMVLLFSSIRMGARVWDAGETRASEVDQILIVQNFLRDQLVRARPVFDDYSDEENEFAFSGTRSSLRFVSMLPNSAGRGGMHLYELLVDEKKGEKTLILKLKPFYPVLDGEEARIEDVRLLNHVQGIELSYFGVDPEFASGEDEDGGEWHDEWVEQDKMPRLIKLVVVSKDGIRWPPLVVEPRVESAETVN